MKILSSTLYEFLSYDDNVGNEKGPPIAWNKTMEVNHLFGYRHSSKYLLLCSAEKKKR